MFQCYIHNWFSSESPCPACYKETTSTTINAEGTSDKSPIAGGELYGYWQCCPCCGGLGYMQEGRVEGTNIVYNCPVCEGAKIIQRPLITGESEGDGVWDELVTGITNWVESESAHKTWEQFLAEQKSKYLLIKK